MLIKFSLYYASRNISPGRKQVLSLRPQQMMETPYQQIHRAFIHHIPLLLTFVMRLLLFSFTVYEEIAFSQVFPLRVYRSACELHGIWRVPRGWWSHYGENLSHGNGCKSRKANGALFFHKYEFSVRKEIGPFKSYEKYAFLPWKLIFFGLTICNDFMLHIFLREYISLTGSISCRCSTRKLIIKKNKTKKFIPFRLP